MTVEVLEVEGIPEGESVEWDAKKAKDWRPTVMRPVLEEEPREVLSVTPVPFLNVYLLLEIFVTALRLCTTVSTLEV